MFLRAANNNQAATALTFFQESVREHGLPSRVRGDQGVENVDIARYMIEGHGTGRGIFISGKRLHNQRIERLWRDVWCAVLNIYYDVLHSLEEEGVLNPADSLHHFCARYVYLSRLQTDLYSFTEGWNYHPLRTEQNCTPNQLWEIGHEQNPVDSPDDMEGTDFNWARRELPSDVSTGVQFPALACNLSDNKMMMLSAAIHPNGHSESFGRDIYLHVVNFVQEIVREREG